MTAYNPPKIVDTRPVWKPIGEEANNMVICIERIDGQRVLVTRHTADSFNSRPFVNTPYSYGW